MLLKYGREIKNFILKFLSAKVANLQKANFDLSFGRHLLLYMVKAEPNYLINKQT